MSSMLEQAIIDAEALKEAALKNAEQVIIEKYSEEVKNAVDNLLEQDELDLDLNLEAVEGEEGEEEVVEEEDKPYDQLPYKHRTVEGGDNDIAINLEQLEEQIEKIYGELNPKEENYVLVSEDKEEEQEDLDEEIEIELTEDEDEEIELTEDAEFYEKSEEEEAGEGVQKGGEEAEVEGEEAVKKEAIIRQAVEEAFRVDYKTVPTGHVGAFTNLEWEYAEEMNAIKTKYEELEEKNEKQRKLMEQALQIINVMETKNKKYETAVEQLKTKLVETNLTNARLYYKNQVLASPSLNERQKENIVEALSQADSPKQAKTIFETLQSAVGNATKGSPKSLSEAVEKRSLLTVSPKRRQERDTIEEAISSRWQRLAGIKS